MSVAYGCAAEFAASVVGPGVGRSRRRSRRSLPGQLACELRARPWPQQVWSAMLVEAGMGFVTLTCPAALEPGTAVEIVIVGAAGRERTLSGSVTGRRRVSSGTFLLTARVDSGT